MVWVGNPPMSHAVPSTWQGDCVHTNFNLHITAAVACMFHFLHGWLARNDDEMFIFSFSTLHKTCCFVFTARVLQEVSWGKLTSSRSRVLFFNTNRTLARDCSRTLLIFTNASKCTLLVNSFWYSKTCLTLYHPRFCIQKSYIFLLAG